MALLPKGWSISRHILPIAAFVGLLVAIYLMLSGQPDRTLDDPAEKPAHAAGALADAPRVAGSGVVEPSSELVSIGTSLSGLVTDVMVRPGDYVTRGQPLFMVDDRAQRARLEESRAAVAQAEAAIAEAVSASETAGRQLALYRQVEDAAAVSRAEVIRAEGDAAAARSRLSVARAQLEAAQAAASSARTDLARLTVRAPIGGEILAVNIRPGEFVQAGGAQGGNAEAYIEMGETRPLSVRVDIDEDEAIRLETGAAAIVNPRGAADRKVEAKFVRVEPLVVPKRSLTNSASERVDVRVVQVLYELPPTDGLFRVGQQIDAFIPARKAAPGPVAAKAKAGQ
ncbi:efflux RND transporter periplasmic adaptor subunit [Allopontixanthobacter sp.]|uniref:efflux RND transporter periplasmic adaptor subunit n=1 Tax=Allopontixanthobacter sp. TaxID=2906452 RepID=UPI002ABC4598|nr:efflux RND transporter periplasmic adaptor subunit [Allopontixanthobacter sp.]MDZ4306908.1 efflux RND transporter periplasmic adaptor subunit [Allopontixanthobacter sp.]